MTTLVAIVFAGLVTLALGLLALPLARRRDTLIHETRRALQERARFFQFNFFGYVIRLARHVEHIENFDGDTVLIREFEDLRPNLGLLVTAIHGKVTGSIGAVLDRHPRLSSVSLPERATLEAGGEGTQQATYALHLDPPLDPDDTISFSVEMHFERLHKMSRREVMEAYRKDQFKREYSGVEINTPIDQLEIEIVFPPGFAGQVNAEVFYGGSEEIAERESARVRSLLRYERGTATVTVENPLLTYVYAISWLPER